MHNFTIFNENVKIWSIICLFLWWGGEYDGVLKMRGKDVKLRKGTRRNDGDRTQIVWKNVDSAFTSRVSTSHIMYGKNKRERKIKLEKHIWKKEESKIQKMWVTGRKKLKKQNKIWHELKLHWTLTDLNWETCSQQQEWMPGRVFQLANDCKLTDSSAFPQRYCVYASWCW